MYKTIYYNFSSTELYDKPSNKLEDFYIFSLFYEFWM